MNYVLDPYVLDCEWPDGVDLPTLVGPFSTAEEAVEWRDLNVTRGARATLRVLTYPYLRSHT